MPKGSRTVVMRFDSRSCPTRTIQLLRVLTDFIDRSNNRHGEALSWYPQFYWRDGFVGDIKPLSQEEMIFILEHTWSEAGPM